MRPFQSIIDAKNPIPFLELVDKKTIWLCDLHTLLKGGTKIGYQISIAPTIDKDSGTPGTPQALNLSDLLSGLEKSEELSNKFPSDTDTDTKVRAHLNTTLKNLAALLENTSEKMGKPGGGPPPTRTNAGVSAPPPSSGSEKPGNAPMPSTPNPKDTGASSKPSVIDDELIVRDLYRFRIIAGPVYSSLAASNQTFSTITNVNGQHVITSSRKNDSPVNFPVFLKVHLTERDILESGWGAAKKEWQHDGLCPKWRAITKIVAPIVGINMVDSPLKNFYAGLSFDIIQGVDIVAGAHISKVNHLDGGFQDGQVVASTAAPPQSEKLSVGGFAGITVDIGVVGSWLGAGIAKGIRDGFK